MGETKGAAAAAAPESLLLYKLEAIRFSSSSRGKPSYVTGREKEEEKERKC